MEFDRRPVGNARAHGKDDFFLFSIHIDEFFHLRPRTHKAHVAEKHINDLRKFINFESANQFTNFCYSHIVCIGGRSAFCFRIRNHAAEFEDTKGFPISANS